MKHNAATQEFLISSSRLAFVLGVCFVLWGCGQPSTKSKDTGAVSAPPVETVSSDADGKALYSSHCAVCHGPIESSTIKNRTLAGIEAALSSVPVMSGVRATAAELAKIVASLQ